MVYWMWIVIAAQLGFVAGIFTVGLIQMAGRGEDVHCEEGKL